MLSGLLRGLEYRAVKVSRAQLLLRRQAARILRLRYRRKGIYITILAVLVGFIQFVFPYHLALASAYNSYVFRPFQTLRNTIFGALPFSVGDFFYLILFLVVLAVMIRWIYLMIRIRSYGHELVHSLLNTIITITTFYLLFFIGWGGNYYKSTLSTYWGLRTPKIATTADLVRYDSFLIRRLNALAPHYKGLSFYESDTLAKHFYRVLTDAKTRPHGLRAKASLYGYFMQYLGIQGYYNPFTGEAQVNGALPQFMLPFVICHEMAHQCGIAAEDDANLLSYAICTVASDSAFAYSGYFNLWLYTQSRLKHLDSVLAKHLMVSLNPLSLAQLDTLRAIRRKYRNGLSDYSGALYDSYLRMHHQQEGLASYDKVAFSAWAWEQRRAGGLVSISIP